MNTDIRKKAKNDFEIDFFNFINNSVFGRKNYLKCEKTRRRNNLVSEPNYHTKNFFQKSY